MTPIKIQSLLFVVLLVLFMNGRIVAAAVIDDLYDATIPVDSQTQKQQEYGFALALKQVLVKVRGNIDILDNLKIKQTMQRATRLVQAYQYEQIAGQLYLVVNFDPQRVRTLIRETGFPVWDKRRPESLVWLAIENAPQGSREIASTVNYPELHQQLKNTADLRGIALMFPLWDLNDHQNLNRFDIWGGFISQLKQASERYSVRSVLSARIYSDLPNEQPSSLSSSESDRWIADWTMIENGTILSGQLTGNTPENLSTKLVNNLADKLSDRYAIDLVQLDASKRKVSIVINNIDSLGYYAQALKLLENLSVVNNVTLVAQQGQKATFELDLLGGIDALNNALSLDVNIQPVVDDFGQSLGNMEFFWVK